MAPALELSRGALSSYEHDIRPPKGLVLRRWAELTGVSEWWLRTGNGPTNGPNGGAEVTVGFQSSRPRSRVAHLPLTAPRTPSRLAA